MQLSHKNVARFEGCRGGDCGGEVILNSEIRRQQQYELGVMRAMVTEYEI